MRAFAFAACCGAFVLNFLHAAAYPLFTVEALSLLLVGLTGGALLGLGTSWGRGRVLGWSVLVLLLLELQTHLPGTLYFTLRTELGAPQVLATAVLLLLCVSPMAMPLHWRIQMDAFLTLLACAFAGTALVRSFLPPEPIYAHSAPTAGEYESQAQAHAAPAPEASAAGRGGEAPLPNLLLFIVDAHIGVEGVSSRSEYGRSTKAWLRESYESRGFRLYGNAFSNFHDTLPSVSTILDGSLERQFPNEMIRNAKLKRSRLFEQLAARGYMLRIYQNDYFDLCAAVPHGTRAHCFTHRYQKHGVVHELPFAPSTKLSLLLHNFAFDSGSAFFSRGAARIFGLAPSSLAAGAFGAPHTLGGLRRDLEKHQRGTAYVVHLLLPHDPFLFTEECALRPVREWQMSLWQDEAAAEVKTERYLHQLRCIQSKLLALFDELSADDALSESTIVVLGDHGSRIVVAPDEERFAASEEVRSHFSAFLAVKDRHFSSGRSGYEPGYSDEYLPTIAVINSLFQLRPTIDLHNHRLDHVYSREGALGAYAHLVSGEETTVDAAVRKPGAETGPE